MTIEIGILLALACAFVANLAFFYKHRGANSVSRVEVRHPLRSARALYSSRWFTLGMIIATASWGLHRAPRRHAGCRLRHPLRCLGHGHQGAHRDHGCPWGARSAVEPLAGRR